mmetsp:Transcript_1217/g.2221  ORF Transcript_1217/g.2221 Transcript_1217/m.2221 type:complete len:136 (+) Transcript_1217:709-1116(+)
MKTLYDITATTIPAGKITGKMRFDQVPFTTPLGKQIKDSMFQSFLEIENLQFLPQDPNFMAHVTFLFEGLSEEQLNQVELIREQVANGEKVCCFEDPSGTNPQIKDLLTGYGRLILYQERGGIVELSEGHYTKSI